MRKHPELQGDLATPLPSIRPPFHEDGEIDSRGLRNLIDLCIENGAKALLLTYGNSLFSVLTDDEVAELTKAVVEHCAGRARVIAADRAWWTGKTVEFARYCRGLGADILMVRPPDFGHSFTVETLVEHYGAIAQEMPVMMVSAPFAPRGQAFGLDVVRQVRDRVSNVVAIKDDFAEEFGRRMTTLVADKWTVIAGGQNQTHLYLAPYGCRGYLSLFTVFKPEITRRYVKAIEEGRYDEAGEIVSQYDMPVYKLLKECVGGFDAGIHAWSELAGIYGRHRRKPFHTATDAEVEALGAALRDLDLL